MAALVSGFLALPARAVADPNDSPAGASGPLLHGAFWSESISTENDVDWYVLYSGGSTELGIHLNSQGPDDCFGQVMELTDADGQFLANYGYPINRFETQHILYTVGLGTFYVKVSPYNVAPCIGSDAKYVLWATASPALLAAPPAIPPPAPAAGKPGGSTGPPIDMRCRNARTRVSGLKKKLRRARGANYRNVVRAELRRARAAVARRC
jgi:hypothetical protein